MSKNPPTIQASLSTKASLKPKNSIKGLERNLVLDLNKFDIRSPTAGTTGLNEKQFYSPTIPSEKGGVIQTQAKSPRAKNNLVTITTDNLDPRDGGVYDNKVHPQTTKTLRSSYIAPSNEKFKPIPNSNEKIVPTKPRESFVKAGPPKYEAFLSKKIAQNKDTSKTDLTINLKDSKTKIMEEPPKKLSMPVNNILTPNNLPTNPGSNSHRAPSSSTEQIKNSNKAPQTAHLYRKDSQKSDNEIENPNIESIVTNKHAQVHHPLSVLLAELGTVSPKHAQGMSRINIGNINGNNSAHGINLSENIASPKEGGQNNDLIRLLNDKNKEIYRLTNDKLELKSTLESLNGEISGLKKMKMLLREKEKIIEDLQGSLCEAAKESEDLMRELQKENLIPRDASFSDSQNHIQGRRTNNISASDMEGVKMLISQLKALTDDSESVANRNGEQKRSLVEAISRKNQSSKGKRTEAAYDSFSLEKRGDKAAQSPDPYNTMDLYQRNFSGTLEETLGRKATESPYYDAMKTTVRRPGKTMSEAKKELVEPKRVQNEAQSTTKILPSGNAIIKRGDSLLGTPRKLHVSPDKTEKQFRVQPSTTTCVDADILARKFSHEPKLVSKGSTDFLNKKQSVAEAGSTLAYTTEKDVAAEPLDIGKGLTELKDRIARLLSKHRDDHKMLKETHDMYLKKFQELLKS